MCASCPLDCTRKVNRPLPSSVSAPVKQHIQPPLTSRPHRRQRHCAPIQTDPLSPLHNTIATNACPCKSEFCPFRRALAHAHIMAIQCERTTLPCANGRTQHHHLRAEKDSSLPPSTDDYPLDSLLRTSISPLPPRSTLPYINISIHTSCVTIKIKLPDSARSAC